MNPYLPVLAILLFSIVFGVAISLMSKFLGPRKYDKVKYSVYECGLPLVTTAREPMSVKFYLTAILFILFDIETVFLFLWAKTFNTLGWLGLIEVTIFVAILVAGYIYVLKRGALEWD
jgi:NADH-quinone oxidoreductase subunit A